MVKHFPLPLQFQPTRWNEKVSNLRQKLPGSESPPVSIKCGSRADAVVALKLMWLLPCCRDTRAAILTSAHSEDINSPSKPPWGSQGWHKQSRLHPNPNLSVAKLSLREAPVLASPGLPWPAGR